MDSKVGLPRPGQASQVLLIILPCWQFLPTGKVRSLLPWGSVSYSFSCWSRIFLCFAWLPSPRLLFNSWPSTGSSNTWVPTLDLATFRWPIWEICYMDDLSWSELLLSPSPSSARDFAATAGDKSTWYWRDVGGALCAAGDWRPELRNVCLSSSRWPSSSIIC